MKIPQQLSCYDCFDGVQELKIHTYYTCDSKGNAIAILNTPEYVCNGCGSRSASLGTVQFIREIREVGTKPVDDFNRYSYDYENNKLIIKEQ